MLVEALRPGSLKGSNGDDQYLSVVQRYGDSTDANAQLQALAHYGITARLVQNADFQLLEEQIHCCIQVHLFTELLQAHPEGPQSAPDRPGASPELRSQWCRRLIDLPALEAPVCMRSTTRATGLRSRVIGGGEPGNGSACHWLAGPNHLKWD